MKSLTNHARCVVSNELKPSDVVSALVTVFNTFVALVEVSQNADRYDLSENEGHFVLTEAATGSSTSGALGDLIAELPDRTNSRYL